MQFELDRTLAVLERTPNTLDALLRGLPDDWTRTNEGVDSWSPFDVVGHLIHGEETDWIPRAEIILRSGSSKPFEPFDRFAQFEASRGKTMDQLLDRFAQLRVTSLQKLRGLYLTESDLAQEGQHPDFGTVTLEQLLATWVAHDLGHIAQIVRVMAKQYSEAVGPWNQFLSVLHR